MQVPIKLLDPKAKIPSYAHEGDSGCDLSSLETCVIPSKGSATIGTGVCIALPNGYEAQVRSRSGLAANYSVCVLNSPGTVDASYRGEIKVILINLGDDPYQIEVGDRIAQLVIAPVVRVDWSDSIWESTTTRGENGIGSTGLTPPSRTESAGGFSETLREYFTYHPVQTDQRRKFHEEVNTTTLAIAEALCHKPGDLDYFQRQLKEIQKLYQLLHLTQNAPCRRWALDRIVTLQQWIGDFALKKTSVYQEGVIMYVQQIRMFLNQGITLDEILSVSEDLDLPF